MRAAQIKVGEEYMACRYPSHRVGFDMERMQQREWEHFASQAVRVRVVERHPTMHASWTVDTLSAATGDAHRAGEVFRSSQILAPWTLWEQGYLDYFQREDEKAHERLVDNARRKVAEAERSAAHWRVRTLEDAREALRIACEVLDVDGYSEQQLQAFVELAHPDGNRYDESIAKAMAELQKLEDGWLSVRDAL